MNQWVTLSRAPQVSNDSDGYFEDLSPAGAWAAIEPQGSAGDGRTQSHIVTMRYRSDVTIDTRIVHGTRELFVRSVQNVNEGNREIVCVCEEVIA